MYYNAYALCTVLLYRVMLSSLREQRKKPQGSPDHHPPSSNNSSPQNRVHHLVHQPISYEVHVHVLHLNYIHMYMYLYNVRCYLQYGIIQLHVHCIGNSVQLVSVLYICPLPPPPPPPPPPHSKPRTTPTRL